MSDLIEKLESPEVIRPAIIRLQMCYRGALAALQAWQLSGPDDTAKALACMTAAITGNLSAVRKIHGAQVAEAMLRQVTADTGLDLTRGRK